MKIYNYFRSGTSHRLRIVLNLKGLVWDYVAVDLRAEAHFDAAFKVLNPQGFVPTLVDADLVLTQSPAIIQWLEERSGFVAGRCQSSHRLAGCGEPM